MPDVVNDALALAQFITNGRSEEQAVTYLLAIEKLSIESWRLAKRELPIEDTTNHRTKEGFIKQIVSYMCNTEFDTNYCLKDLSLCPGFSKEALQLVFYNSAAFHCVQTVSSTIAQQAAERTPDASSRSRDLPTAHSAEANNAGELASGSKVKLPVASQQLDNNDASSAPPSGSETPGPPNWVKVNNNRAYKRANNSNNKQSRRNWIVGSSPSTDTSINHQLRPVCLGVRSGAEETSDSLKAIVEKWNCAKNIQVDPARKSLHSATFRVQFDIPVSLVNKWREPTAWPTRCWVSEWRGNPKSALKPLNEHIQKARLYIGNLSESATEKQITDNMKSVYSEEIQKGSIHQIEAVFNHAGLTREMELRSQDPSHQVKKSACIILSSKPGENLPEIDLKLERYSYEIRRTVRKWNGPTPHSTKEPETKLVW